jgi:hypothetical protein
VETDSLARAATLLRERNAIDVELARLIHRPMTSGHLGEWIAAQIFGIELEESAVAAGIDGRFRSGPCMAAEDSTVPPADGSPLHMDMRLRQCQHEQFGCQCLGNFLGLGLLFIVLAAHVLLEIELIEVFIPKRIKYRQVSRHGVAELWHQRKRTVHSL